MHEVGKPLLQGMGSRGEDLDAAMCGRRVRDVGTGKGMGREWEGNPRLKSCSSAVERLRWFENITADQLGRKFFG